MRLFRDEHGQTTIITAVAIMCLCGLTGFSVDVGALFKAKRICQTAADAAALAGIAELAYGNATSAATAMAARDGVTNGVSGYTLTINNPPSSGPHASDSKYVEVIVSQNAPTYFMQLFNLKSMSVSARAVGGNGPSNACIVALDASGNDVGLSGSGDLSMPGCGVMVNSGSNNALSLSGSSSLVAQSIGVVGNYSDSSNGALSPLPVTGMAPEPNPLSNLPVPTFTPSTCLADPKPTGGTTIGPSSPTSSVCYNGLSLNGSGSVTFRPGIYIINGSFSSSGSVNVVQQANDASTPGAGVTIYLAAPNGSMSLTGGGTLNLTAPSSSTYTYNGILFFEDPNDTNVMKVAGNQGSVLTGIFYAPNATLNLQGSSGATFYTDLVVSALSIAGTNNLQNYATVAKTSPLLAPTLVE